MTQTQSVTALPPIVKTIEVTRSLVDTFRLFTDEFAAWWPRASHSVGGPESEWCGIEARIGGRVYERTNSGDEHVWGTVITWQPPHRVAFTWHPGQPADPHTEVEIRFSEIAADRTRVELEHRNWETIGDRAAIVHENYVTGWDVVFGEHFGGFAGGSR